MELAECLVVKAKWGHASTRDEVKQLIQEFVRANKDNEDKVKSI